MSRNAKVLCILALTQIMGWGVVSILPVLAAPMAAQLHSSLPSIFAGATVMYVAMALAAPPCGRAFRRHGARRVMAAGAALLGLALIVMGIATGLLLFWAAWALAGVAGAMFLTTAAYAYLAEYASAQARQHIGSLMLLTGLASSVFWPITAWLDHLSGWRATVLIFAALMLLIAAPLIWLGLPATEAAAASGPTQAAGTGRRRIFLLLASAIALNSFVTLGIQMVGIPLLQAMGLPLASAVTVGTLLGVFKVGGRLLDVMGGQRWDALSTGLAAGAMMVLGLALIAGTGVGLPALAGFLLLFGLGSGAFAVARATMPLQFFAKGDYAAAMSTIALPINLINAVAAPAIASLMLATSPALTFAILAGLSLAAWVLLLPLRQQR